MMATNTINIALPFRHLNEDEMRSMYRFYGIHGEGKLYLGNNFNNTKMDLSNVSIFVTNIRSSYQNIDL